MEDKKNCLVCKKEFVRPYRLAFSLWNIRKYCGLKCYYSVPKTSEYRNKMREIMLGNKNWIFRGPISQEGKDSARKRMIGNKYATGTMHVRARMFGEKNPRWKNDKSIMAEKHRMRGSLEWKNWREAVFKRDGFRCIDCGEKGYLEPHHIIPLKETLSRAFDKNNGITLCRPCHRKTMGKELELSRTYFSFVPAQI